MTRHPNEHHDGLIGLCELTRLLAPHFGGRPNAAILHRWILSGRLPAIRVRGEYFVAPTEIARFARHAVDRRLGNQHKGGEVR